MFLVTSLQIWFFTKWSKHAQKVNKKKYFFVHTTRTNNPHCNEKKFSQITILFKICKFFKYDTVNYSKKTGLHCNKLRHCAYIIYRVKTFF